MEEDFSQEISPSPQESSIFQAALHHQLESLRILLRNGSPNFHDPTTGFTPLHAAIAVCAAKFDSSPSRQDALSNGGTHILPEPCNDMTAVDILKLLLQNGAVWNDVNNENETPGCMALRFGLKESYDVMVDAGVRSELLLNRLNEYEQLNDSNGEGDEEEGDEPYEKQNNRGDPDETTSTRFTGNADSRPGEEVSENPIGETDLDNENYLQSSLRFQDSRILDNSGNGVMMAWEKDIMKCTSDLLVSNSGLRVLNIGHGMGIIDTFFQEKAPSAHHIVEAHPAILERMKRDGWDTKAGVTIHEGRWQDVIPKIIEQGILFDAIYFDTFAEDYTALRDFSSDSIIGLLDDAGKWGFFNGLGADRQICYDVYQKVVEMDLFEAGFDTTWKIIPVPTLDKEEWEGMKRRYWALEEYYLPICEFIR